MAEEKGKVDAKVPTIKVEFPNGVAGLEARWEGCSPLQIMAAGEYLSLVAKEMLRGDLIARQQQQAVQVSRVQRSVVDELLRRDGKN